MPSFHEYGQVASVLEMLVEVSGAEGILSIGDHCRIQARHTAADTSVVGLIGERGREAREFIEDDLGEEGMKRSVVVVATSDEPPMVRRQVAYLTMAVSEFFQIKTRMFCV